MTLSRFGTVFFLLILAAGAKHLPKGILQFSVQQDHNHKMDLT